MIPSREDKSKFAEYVYLTMGGFADGRPLEYSYRERDTWFSCVNPTWDWRGHDYRLAPEPPKVSVEPWTFETAPIWVKVRGKKDGQLGTVVICTDGAIFDSTVDSEQTILTYAELADQFEQLDGTPCGTVKSDWPKWFRSDKWPTVMLCRYDSETEAEDIGFDGRKADAMKWTWQMLQAQLAQGGVEQITAAEAEALLEKARAK